MVQADTGTQLWGKGVGERKIAQDEIKLSEVPVGKLGLVRKEA